MKKKLNDNYITSYELANDLNKLKEQFQKIESEIENSKITTDTINFLYNDMETNFAIIGSGEVGSIIEKLIKNHKDGIFEVRKNINSKLIKQVAKFLRTTEESIEDEFRTTNRKGIYYMLLEDDKQYYRLDQKGKLVYRDKYVKNKWTYAFGSK